MQQDYQEDFSEKNKNTDVSVTSTDQLYLDRLSFDPKLKKGFFNFFVSHIRVVMLMIVLITVSGLYSFFQLPRESNPEVKIAMAMVHTFYPGASPADVEELITKKIETEISGLQYLKKITSNSLSGVSSIVVEFDAQADLNSSIRNLRDKVNTVKPKLPTDAKEPSVFEVSLDDQPVLLMAFTGPYDGFTMRSYAQDIKDELEKIPGIREVQLSGGNEKEYQVAYDIDKLLYYKINPSVANQAITAANIAFPAGVFDSKTYQYAVRTDGRVYTPQTISSIPIGISSNGGIVTVGDVAEVSLHAIKKSTLSRLSINGETPHEAVSLAIIKRTGASVIDTINLAITTTEQTTARLAPGLKFDVTQNFAKIIERDFTRLEHDFLITVVLVFSVLFLVVGLKEAIVAGLAIPLVFFIAFTTLHSNGISLNFLSLFSLILSLGLLVDDAIVVVTATKQYMKTGKFTPEEAILLVLRDFKVVLTTTTLTTVWAFLPLLFASGIIGEYIKSIPITVSIVLIASLFVALTINNPLAALLGRLRLTKKMFYVIEGVCITIGAGALYSGSVLGYGIFTFAIVAIIVLLRWYEKGGRTVLEKNTVLMEKEWKDDSLVKQKMRAIGNDKNENLSTRLMHGIIHFDALIPVYEKYVRLVVLDRKIRRRTITGVIFLFLFSVSLPVTGIVKSEFFPKSDSDNIYIDINAPVGYKLEQTSNLVQHIEEKLITYPVIKNFATFVGSVSPMNQNGKPSPYVGYIAITLVDENDRSIKSYEFSDQLRVDLSDIPLVEISVAAMSGGPPAGAAFEARINGIDLDVLSSIARDLQEKLSSIHGVVESRISLKNTAPEYTFILDHIAMEQHLLNAASVGSVLRMAIAGTEISTILEKNKEIKIVARFSENSLPDLSAIQNLQILNAQGIPVFLKDIARIELKPSVDAITRIDQKRTVLLSANVTKEISSTEVFNEFKKKIVGYSFPQGYGISYGGENEQNQESVLSIIRAMVIAFILIISTLIVQFDSFRKAVIVLITIPLALIGVFLGLATFGVPLSFPGLIGILALFGIVVKNAIILVDKINLNIKTGIPFSEAIIDAGKSRMEAIFITSISTIFGILPVTLSNATWTALGSAVIFGLMLSSFLTLFIIPSLFVMMIKNDDTPQEIST